MTSSLDLASAGPVADASLTWPSFGAPDRAAGQTAAGERKVVSALRQCLGLDDALDDRSILASLDEIARFADPSARRQAALDSTLGHWLALQGMDLDARLRLVVATTPLPRF